jgi:hypothetical protein
MCSVEKTSITRSKPLGDEYRGKALHSFLKGYLVMPAKDPRSAEIDRVILEVYPMQGPGPIMERFGLTKCAVYSRANKLRILADSWRHGSGTRDPRRDEIDQMIRAVYPTHGPGPIMEKFGLTKHSVHTHARLLGVKFNHEDKYDLSIWTPNLTKIGAYYLGLAWSDGCAELAKSKDIPREKRRCRVRFGQAGEEDRKVLDYLAMALKLPADMVKPGKRRKEHHKTPYRLNLSGERVVSLFLDHFQIPQRKSFVDPPYPNVPDEFLAAFTCGQYDGDGSTRVKKNRSINPYYNFYGTPTFLETFRQKLQDQVGVQFRPMRPHQKNNRLWVFGVYDVRQTVPLTRFLYHGYYQEEGVPYFKRKHEPFQWFLTPGYFTIRGGHLVWL